MIILTENAQSIDKKNLKITTARLIEENPSQMIEWFESLPEGSLKSSLITKAAEHWFDVDEAKTIDYINSISNQQTKESVTSKLLDHLAYRKPQKFLDLYSTIESQSSYSDLLDKAIKQLGQYDASYVIKKITDQTDTKLRKSIIRTAMKDLSDIDPEQALFAANQLTTPSERDSALASIYKNILYQSPLIVANAFKERGLMDIGSFKVEDFIYTYAKGNLEDAKSFVDTIEDPVLWEKSVLKLLNVWAMKEPLDAMEFALQQGSEKNIKSITSEIGRFLTEDDREAAFNMALAQPKNAISQDLLSGILRTWLIQDLETAIDAIENTSVERTGTSIYSSAASKYAEVNAPQAGQWVNSIQDQSAQDNATSSLISKWVESDPSSAITWVEQLKSGSQKDTAIKRLVDEFKGSEPLYAIEWASNLSQDASSKSLIQYTYHHWKTRDPQAANDWLNSTNLVSNHDRTVWQK